MSISRAKGLISLQQFYCSARFNNLIFVEASTLSSILRGQRDVRLNVNTSLPTPREWHFKNDTASPRVDKCILNSSVIPYCALAETRIEESPDRTTHGGELPPTLGVGFFTRHCIARRLLAWQRPTPSESFNTIRLRGKVSRRNFQCGVISHTHILPYTLSRNCNSVKRRTLLHRCSQLCEFVSEFDMYLPVNSHILEAYRIKVNIYIY